MPVSYEDVLRSVEALSPTEQLRLIAEVAEYLRIHTEPESRSSILELQGMGKEIWKGVDAQAYIDRERGSWNG